MRVRAQDRQGIYLQKILFIASRFANPDGTINTYIDGFDFVPEKQDLIRMANALILGDYVFTLSGNTIVAIKTREGSLIVDNIAIPVPPVLLANIPLTASTIQLQNRPIVVTLQDLGKIEAPVSIEATSVNLPNQYLPIMDKAGEIGQAMNRILTASPNPGDNFNQLRARKMLSHDVHVTVGIPAVRP